MTDAASPSSSPSRLFIVAQDTFTETVSHDFGLLDSKGRAIGANVYLGTATLSTEAGHRWLGDSDRDGLSEGVVPTLSFHATRDGVPFGAIQRIRFFADEEARSVKIAKYLRSAKKRAAKNGTPAAAAEVAAETAEDAADDARHLRAEGAIAGDARRTAAAVETVEDAETVSAYAAAAEVFNKGRRSSLGRIDATLVAVVVALGRFNDRGASSSVVASMVLADTGAVLSELVLIRVVDAHRRYLRLDDSTSYTRLTLSAAGRRLALTLDALDEEDVVEKLNASGSEAPAGAALPVPTEEARLAAEERAERRIARTDARAEAATDDLNLVAWNLLQKERADSIARAVALDTADDEEDLVVAFIEDRPGAVFPGTVSEATGLSAHLTAVALSDAVSAGRIRRIHSPSGVLIFARLGESPSEPEPNVLADAAAAGTIAVPPMTPEGAVGVQSPEGGFYEIHETSPERVEAHRVRDMELFLSAAGRAVKTAVRSSDDADWIAQVRSSEADGRNRTSVLRGIDARLRALSRRSEAPETPSGPVETPEEAEVTEPTPETKEETPDDVALRAAVLGMALDGAISDLHGAVLGAVGSALDEGPETTIAEEIAGLDAGVIAPPVVADELDRLAEAKLTSDDETSGALPAVEGSTTDRLNVLDRRSRRTRALLNEVDGNLAALLVRVELAIGDESERNLLNDAGRLSEAIATISTLSRDLADRDRDLARIEAELAAAEARHEDEVSGLRAAIDALVR